MKKIVNKYLSHITIVDGVLYDTNDQEINGYDLIVMLRDNFDITEELAEELITEYLTENHGFTKEIFEDFFIPFPPTYIKDFLSNTLQGLQTKNRTEEDDDDI